MASAPSLQYIPSHCTAGQSNQLSVKRADKLGQPPTALHPPAHQSLCKKAVDGTEMSSLNRLVVVKLMCL